jgi:hypothetical protein
VDLCAFTDAALRAHRAGDAIRIRYEVDHVAVGGEGSAEIGLQERGALLPELLVVHVEAQREEPARRDEHAATHISDLLIERLIAREPVVAGREQGRPALAVARLSAAHLERVKPDALRQPRERLRRKRSAPSKRCVPRRSGR